MRIVLIIRNPHCIALKMLQKPRKRNKNLGKAYTNVKNMCYNTVAIEGSKCKDGDHMATVFDVANYILRKKGPMTTMKLQKLCYYAQSWSLAWDERPLFDEDFEAWANGPVCPELYRSHQGKFELPCDYFMPKDFDVYDFTSDQLETIDKVIEYYGDKEPQWLSDLTHKEAPWLEARGDVPPGMRCNNVIPKESMQEYYGGL